MHRRLERGIREDRHGLQAYVWVDGRLRAKRFPPGTPLTKLRAWREDQRVAARHGLEVLTTAQTFRADVEAYLELVGGMATFQDRAYRMAQWSTVFGARPRDAITPQAIRAQLERWRLNGRQGGGPLSPGSLNQRRTALMHFFTVMNGRGGANPAKDVPPYAEPTDDAIRAQPWRVWYRLLVRLGRRRWKARRADRRGRRAPDSKTRARLRLMLWTGWSHRQIMQLRPEDIDWEAERVRVSRRQKGKGRPATWLPLLPPAWRALRAFEAADAWGDFSQSAMHSALARAVEQENAWRVRWRRPALPRIRPYDARHSALTLMAQLTTDERALQDLALHGTARQTRRYTRGADDLRLAEAVATIGARIR